MGSPLHVLIAEDSDKDLSVLLEELRRGGFEPEFERVDSPDRLDAALVERKWELVLSDYRMRRLDARQALDLLRRHRCDLPVVIISEDIGEDAAVELMKSGVSDCLRMDNVSRLAAVVQRELRLSVERRNARKAEEFNRRLVESSPDIILTVSESGQVASLNTAFGRITGRRPEQWIGRPFADLVHPDDRPSAKEQFGRVLNGESPEAFTLRLEVEPAGFRVAEFTVSAQREEGHITGVLGIARDVTDRRNADETLRKREEEYRVLSESVKELAVFRLDPQGKVSGWNFGAERLTGYAGAEIMGRPLSQFFIPEDVKKGLPKEELKRAAAEDRADDENWLVRKDGSRFWASGFSRALRDPSGRLIGFAKVVRDETVRRRADDRRRLRDEAGAALLRLLAARDPSAMLEKVAGVVASGLGGWCLIDLAEPGGTVRRAAAAYAEPGREQVLSRLLAERRLRTDAAFGADRVLRTGEPEIRSEVPDAAWAAAALGLTGSETPAELGDGSFLCVPLRDGGQTLGAVSVVSTDPSRRFDPADLETAAEIAGRAASAPAIIRLQRQTEEAVAARDDFISIASHELRTPLSGIHGLLQLLHRKARDRTLADLPPEMLEENLGIMERQARLMGALIGELLDYARLRSGRFRLQPAETDLSKLVRDVAARYAADPATVGGPLRLIADQPVVGRWDPVRLDQVATNLIGNALRYGRGRLVEVAVAADDRTARLTVTDHGIGISNEDQRRIFDRFERAVAAPNHAGLGLGLYICRQIVEAHHGAIRVRSEPGVGSTFTVELPRS